MATNKAVLRENGKPVVVNKAWVDFWRRVGANPRGLRDIDVKEKP